MRPSLEPHMCGSKGAAHVPPLGVGACADARPAHARAEQHPRCPQPGEASPSRAIAVAP
jgi:hypothetical protein